MKWIYLLGYLAMPAVLVLHFWFWRDVHGAKSWEPMATFALAGISIVPLASLMGRATEQLAVKTGPTWGGLLNATFGNAAELIIGIVALTRGLNDVAMASLSGSIIGNLLLVAGGAMLAGGWKREQQAFSRAGAEANAGLLAVAVAAMLLPAIFHFSYASRDAQLHQHEHGISVGTSVVLLIVYGLGLLFTLRTHSHLFTLAPAMSEEDPVGISDIWPVWKSLLALFIASGAVAIFSELLVGSVEHTAAALHWNHIFVGVIVVAIIGNAAEHSTAVLLARNNDMDTAMTIVFQSSLQIALFVTPALVLLSTVFVRMGLPDARRMDLVFSPLEVVAVLLSVALVVILSRNGQSNWFEGILLLAVYAILGITFFYIPSGGSAGYDAAGPHDAEREIFPAPPARPAAIKDVTHATARE